MVQGRYDELAAARTPLRAAGYEVPATEAAVFELLGWLHTDPMPTGELGRVIRREPGLTASVLRAADDGVAPWTESLGHAVGLLGFDGLQQLALSVPLLDARERRHARMCQLVLRSRRAAHVLTCLANECDWPEPELAYIAGLLLEFQTLQQLWRASQAGWGWMEGQSGPERLEAQELTRVWRLPPAVATALVCWEKPDEAQEHQLLVRLAALAAVSSGDPILQQAAGSGGPLLRATELVKRYLPRLSLSRQMGLAEILTTELRRCDGSGPGPAPEGSGNGRVHG
jgi:hypothetical protein